MIVNLIDLKIRHIIRNNKPISRLKEITSKLSTLNQLQKYIYFTYRERERDFNIKNRLNIQMKILIVDIFFKNVASPQTCQISILPSTTTPFPRSAFALIFTINYKTSWSLLAASSTHSSIPSSINEPPERGKGRDRDHL